MGIQVPPDSTGKVVETNSPDGATQRQVVTVGDSATTAGVAKVQNADPASTDYGITTRDVRGNASLPVRIDPTGTTTQPVSGTVSVNALPTGSNVIGHVINDASTAVIGHVIADTGSTTAVTGNVTVVQATGTNLHTVVDSGTITANIGTSGSLALDASITALEVAQASTTSGQKGMLVQGAVTTNAPTYTTAQTDPLSLDTSGLLRVSVKDTPQNTTAFKVDGSAVTQPVSGTVTVGNATLAVTESGTWNVGASTATGAAAPANAFYNGALAKTALPTAATDGNLTGVMVDKFGRQVCLLGSIRDLTGTQTTTLSASTSETTIVTAGAAGVFNDLVMLIVSNTSASTNTRIDFRDTTAGTILFSLESIGGAAPIGFALPIPIPQTTAATNWTAQCATSTTDVRIYAVFVKNK